MPERKVCVVTGTRAEYGLLYWILRGIANDPRLALQLAVTGTHLSPEFGRTASIIEGDGFTIDAAVEMLLSSDSPVGVAKGMGLGVIGFADAFARLQPDIVVLLGDRFEAFAAAQAALVAGVPIAHIHGGETTEGAFDEALRHGITKMAHIHFVAAERYGRRVEQMGEDPSRVHDVGAPGLEYLRRVPPVSDEEFAERVGFAPAAPFLLVTHHPSTLAGDRADEARELLSALDTFPEASVILTGSNADTGGRELKRRLRDWAEARKGNTRFVQSLGQELFLTALRRADVMVGNSSSGIIEAPAAGVTTVNVGPRQRGRLRAPSIIDCAADAEEIAGAIRKALSPEFQALAARAENPYGEGDTSGRIVEVLAEVSLGPDLLMKRFVDLPIAEGP